jgi:16S rRNA processing protein RimM
MCADHGGPWLAFGYVGRPHGVRGEVHLHAYNSRAESPKFLRCPLEIRLKIGESEQVATLLGLRGKLGKFLLRFQGFETRESVSALVNSELLLPRSCFPPLGPGEFYVEDLRSYDVFDTRGKSLGVVNSIFWNGAQDVLQISSSPDDPDDEYLIPVVGRYIQSVDPSRKKIVVVLDD